MRKSTSLIIGIIIAIVVIGGGYALIKHHDKTTPAATTSSSSSSSGSSTSVSNAVLMTETNSTLGNYLATPSNAALYTFGGDSAGVSKCTGSCLAAWPAYQDTGAAAGLPANIGTITRSDNGEVQYTYKGLPLYTFLSDSKGEATGDGVSGFHLAKP